MRIGERGGEVLRALAFMERREDGYHARDY